MFNKLLILIFALAVFGISTYAIIDSLYPGD